MVLKLYLWEVNSKLNQTRLLGFQRSHFPFWASAFQHSELLLLQIMFKAISGGNLLSKTLMYKMKRDRGHLQTSEKDVRGETLTSFDKF